MSIPWKQRDQPERLALRLMRSAPAQRTSSGGWRWGTRRIGPSVVARLLAEGVAEIVGNRLQLSTCQRPGEKS